MKQAIIRPLATRNFIPAQKILFALALLAGLNLNTQAHEFWIQANDYSPAVGDIVSLSTHVGQGFVGDEVPNIEDFYSDYSVLSKSGRSPVLGSLATDPPAYIEIDKAGTYIAGQRTLRSFVELDPDLFKEYLTKQGMEFVLPLLKQRGLDDKLAKEAFSRCIKAIIQTEATPLKSSHTAESTLALLATELGYTLEIIPLSNPATLDSGDTFKIKLLYNGQARANTKISAINKTQPEHIITTHTDNNGIAEITLDQAGNWMISAVHIIPIDLFEADWESFWANLTFEID